MARDEDGAKALGKRTLTNLYNARPQWLADAPEATVDTWHTAWLDPCVIVCLGWGSLIWNLAGLPVQKLESGLPLPSWVLSPEGKDIGDWQPDGPQVRVEFARQSGKARDRLTLVLFDAAEPQPSLWVRMTVATLGEAVRALARREYSGTAEKNVDRWSKRNIGQWSEGEADPPDIPGLSVWATGGDIQHVVWTALKPQFRDRPVAPTEDQAVAFLKGLSDDRRATEAEKYIRRTPPQVDTAYRRRIIRGLGWTPVA